MSHRGSLHPGGSRVVSRTPSVISATSSRVKGVDGDVMELTVRMRGERGGGRCFWAVRMRTRRARFFFKGKGKKSALTFVAVFPSTPSPITSPSVPNKQPPPFTRTRTGESRMLPKLAMHFTARDGVSPELIPRTSIPTPNNTERTKKKPKDKKKITPQRFENEREMRVERVMRGMTTS